ncbi:MAG: TRAP transporter small permease subunit [Desulfobacterales bacterium]|nr:TRAP transporter small permease subunit [Desulfobacterales bacterium]
MQCLKCGTEFDPARYECPVCGSEYQGSRLTRYTKRGEGIILEAMLFLMVFMVLAQILLRNLFHTGIPGADDLIRHLVLWIGLLGAAVATRSGAHVKIDVAARLLPDFWRRVSCVVTCLFSSVVCFILTWASANFVYIEYQVHDHTPFLNLPLWIMQVILPVGYLIIAVRFTRNGINFILQLLRSG